MLVKESINFERTNNPYKNLDVGRTSSGNKKGNFEDLKSKGVQFDVFSMGNPGDQYYNTIDDIIEVILEFKPLIHKLHKAGTPYNEMTMQLGQHGGVNLKIGCFQLSTSYDFKFLIKKDAEIMKKIYNNISLKSHLKKRVQIEKTSEYFYLRDIKDWNNIIDLDNLIKFRNDYR